MPTQALPPRWLSCPKDVFLCLGLEDPRRSWSCFLASVYMESHRCVKVLAPVCVTDLSSSSDVEGPRAEVSQGPHQPHSAPGAPKGRVPVFQRQACYLGGLDCKDRVSCCGRLCLSSLPPTQYPSPGLGEASPAPGRRRSFCGRGTVWV